MEITKSCQTGNETVQLPGALYRFDPAPNNGGRKDKSLYF